MKAELTKQGDNVVIDLGKSTEGIIRDLTPKTIGKKGANLIGNEVNVQITKQLGFGTIEYEVFGEFFREEIIKDIKEEYNIKALSDFPNEERNGKELTKLLKTMTSRKDKIFENENKKRIVKKVYKHYKRLENNKNKTGEQKKKLDKYKYLLSDENSNNTYKRAIAKVEKRLLKEKN